MISDPHAQEVAQNTTPVASNVQELTKELLEIFKLRGASLTLNTLVLFWPIIALVVAVSVLPSLGKAWSPFTVVSPLIYLVLVALILFYSIPRAGLDRIEKRFWVKRYLTKREVVSAEDSKAFMQANKKRIIAYRHLIFRKVYLVALLITFVPIAIIVTDTVLQAMGILHFPNFGYVVLIGDFLVVPVLVIFFLFYWLHTRTVLLYAWERFIDAVDDGETIDNQQIYHDARRLVKVLGLRGKAKFMAYDFAVSGAVGAPAAAVTQAARIAPQPVERALAVYALLYSFNAYELENFAVTYSFYRESRAKAAS